MQASGEGEASKASNVSTAGSPFPFSVAVEGEE